VSPLSRSPTNVPPGGVRNKLPKNLEIEIEKTEELNTEKKGEKNPAPPNQPAGVNGDFATINTRKNV